MHDHHRGPCRGTDLDHLGIGEPGDVVQDVNTEIDGSPGHTRAAGVDTDHTVAVSDEPLEDPSDAIPFLGVGHRGGAGPSGLAPYVDHEGTLGDQATSVRVRLIGREIAPAITEGIRGHVHDPHDRAPRPGEFPRTSRPTATRQMGDSRGGVHSSPASSAARTSTARTRTWSRSASLCAARTWVTMRALRSNRAVWRAR